MKSREMQFWGVGGRFWNIFICKRRVVRCLIPKLSVPKLSLLVLPGLYLLWLNVFSYYHPYVEGTSSVKILRLIPSYPWASIPYITGINLLLLYVNSHVVSCDALQLGVVLLFAVVDVRFGVLLRHVWLLVFL